MDEVVRIHLSTAFTKSRWQCLKDRLWWQNYRVKYEIYTYLNLRGKSHNGDFLHWAFRKRVIFWVKGGSLRQSVALIYQEYHTSFFNFRSEFTRLKLVLVLVSEGIILIYIQRVYNSWAHRAHATANSILSFHYVLEWCELCTGQSFKELARKWRACPKECPASASTEEKFFSGAYQLPQKSRSTKSLSVSLEPTLSNLKVHWYLLKLTIEQAIAKFSW